MALLHEFHQPTSLSHALTLLDATDRRLVPLAGGTSLIGQLETRALSTVDGVVDLSKPQLDTITADDTTLTVGAMVTLTDLCAHDVAANLAGGILRRTAQGEGPVNLRNAATIGGLIAGAAPDSEVFAALLALQATVHVTTLATETLIPLDQLTATPAGLITAVTIPLDATAGGHARVARTPSDRPIVAAVAIRTARADDPATALRIALCGVAARPILAHVPLDPPDDFLGSAAYRRAMSAVVMARARQQLL